MTTPLLSTFTRGRSVAVRFRAIGVFTTALLLFELTFGVVEAQVAAPTAQRVQTATITGRYPVRRSFSLPVTASPYVQYNKNVNYAVGGTQLVRLHGMQSGGTKARTLSFGNNRLTVDPAQDFKPGERIILTVPYHAIQAIDTAYYSGGYRITSIEWADPLSYEFRAAATGGTAVLAASSLTNPAGGDDIVLADMDGDSDLDIVTVDYTDGAYVYRNNGFGTFTRDANSVGISRSEKIKAGDMDNDGDLDLVTLTYSSSNYSNWLSVSLNAGDGTFATPVTYALPDGTPTDLALADGDGDGDLDAYVTTKPAPSTLMLMAWLENTGSGTFGTYQSRLCTNCWSSPTAEEGSGTLAVGDFQGDDEASFAISRYIYADRIAFAHNDGNNSFSSYNTNPVLSPYVPPSSMEAGAIYGSTELDLVVNQPSRDEVIVYKMTNGTYVSEVKYSVGDSPEQIKLADMDGDGDLDLVTANSGTWSVGVLLNDGSGTYGTSTDYAIGHSVNRMDVGDVDGDGDLDVVTIGDGRVVVLRNVNTPTGTLSPTSAHTQQTVTISGTYLQYTTGITFNGVAASYTVNSPTSISVTVPFGVTSGPVVVTGSDGAFTAGTFTLLPSVQAWSPDRNALTASRSTNIVWTLSNASTSLAATRTRTFSSQAGGRRLFTSGVLGLTMIANPTVDFKAGEVITAILPATVVTAAGGAFEAKVHQFTTAVGTGAATFTTPTTVTVGSAPQQVETADVDGDGDLDLVTLNNSAGNLSIALNTGTGTFGAATTVSAGSLPRGLAVADVDSDGDLDLLTANPGSGTVALCRNNGSGTFGAATTVASVAGATGLGVGDFDGDGNLDMIVASSSTTPSLWRNSGTGAFSAVGGTFSGSTLYTRVLVGDLDRDGSLDVVLLNSFNSIYLAYTNDGSGTFTSIGSGTFGDQYDGITSGAALGDLNADGYLDLVGVDRYSRKVGVLLNSGSGTFGTATNYALGTTPRGVALGDLDADGDLDVVVASAGTAQALVRLNDGTGTLTSTFTGTPTVSVGTTPYAVALADLDGDLDLDLAVANLGAGTVSVALSENRPLIRSFTPTGGAPATVVTLTGTNFTGATSVTFGGVAATSFTVNSATSLTVVVPTAAVIGPIAVTTPVGTGTSLTNFLLNLQVVSTSPGHQGVLATGSPISLTFNAPPAISTGTQLIVYGSQSGKKSGTVAVSGNTLTYSPNIALRAGETVLVRVPATLLGEGGQATTPAQYEFRVGPSQGSLLYTTTQTLFTGSQPYAMTVGDWDNDGDVDLKTANYTSSTVTTGTNSGTGTFTTASSTLSYSPRAIGAGDFDGSGTTDPLVGFSNLSGNAYYFSALGTTTTVSWQVTDFAVGDINNDGALDKVLLFGSNNSASIRLSTNTTSSISLPGSPTSVVLADLDNDRDLDLLASSSTTGTVAVRFNDGTGQFSGSTSASVAGANLSVVAGDLDNDGDQDLLALVADANQVSVRFNNGAGQFSGTQEVSIGAGSIDLVLLDVDADGDLDLATVSSTENTLRLYENDGTGAFTARVFFTTGNVPNTLLAADVDNDGDMDLLTSNVRANTVTVYQNAGAKTPYIWSFSPTSGVTGATVTLTGYYFTGATAVTINGVSATFSVVSDNEITAVVPVGASGAGYISVTTPVGTGQTTSTFGVVPVISGLSPTSGVTGTTVVITGSSFTGATGITFAGPTAFSSVAATTFTVNSDTQITAVVPSGAGNGYLTSGVVLKITTAGGSATSSTGFTVLPSITSFSPASGPAGTSVTVSGSGMAFMRGFSFNGTSASTTYSSATNTQFTVAVPAGATTGKLSVTTDKGTFTTATDFTVTIGVADFTPTSGPAGHAVVLTGSLLSTVTSVKFNGVSAAFTIDSDGQITAIVPSGATTGTISVTGPSGTYTTTTSFTVLIGAPAVTSFTPSLGGAGAVVTLTGANYTNVTGLSIGGVAVAAFTIVSAMTLTAIVPTGGTGGTLSLTNPAGTTTSAKSFTIINPVVGVSPTRNALSAARTTDITLTYNEAVKNSTATTSNVRAFSAQQGGKRAATVSVVNGAIGLNPTADFRAGETISVTSRSAVTSTAGALAPAHVYQFTTAADVATAQLTSRFAYSMATTTAGVTLADVDADGDLDMIGVGQTSASNKLTIWTNTGDGTATVSTSVALGSAPLGVTAGDLDSDGDLDLVVPLANGTLAILQNINGTYEVETPVSVSTTPHTVALADVTGDGNLDLLVPNAGAGTVSVVTSNGQTTAMNVATVTTLSVGGQPNALAVGDLDSDGDLDLVVADYATGANRVAVWLNAGNGGNATFTVGTAVSVGTRPTTVTLADLNADGFLDLLTADYDADQVSVRFGTGTGTFTGSGSVTAGDGPSALATADMDGDGDLDLLIANALGNTLLLRLNNGAGVFSAPPTGGSYSISGQPSCLAAGDIDGNGTVDVLVAPGSSLAKPYFNQAAPVVSAFSPASGPSGTTVTLTGKNFTAATAVTFGGVAAASYTVASSIRLTAVVPTSALTGVISVTTAYGTGATTSSFVVTPAISSFAPASGPAATVVTITGTGLRNVTGVTFNGVSAASFTVVSGTSLTATVPVGTSTGPLTLTTAHDPVSTATSFAVTFPVTGVSPARHALAVSRTTSIGATFSEPVATATAANVGVFSAQRGGRRGGAATTSGSSLAFAPTLGFLPGEVVSVTVPATVTNAGGAPATPHVHQFTAAAGVAPGSFGLLSTLSVGGSLPQPIGTALADLDGDGDLDLATAALGLSQVLVQLNNGVAAFGPATAYATGNAPADVTAADVDNDGDLDLLTANSTGANSVSILLNGGTGIFTAAASTVAVGQFPAHVVAADVNGDGWLDLLTVNSSTAAPSVSVALNLGTGAGAFAAATSLTTTGRPQSLAVGDLDLDGDLDFVLADRTNSLVRLALNDGSGTFAFSGSTVAVGSSPYTVALADVSRDGRVDILTANNATTTLSVALATGAGTFGAASSVTVPANPYAVAPADVDGDGDLDLVTIHNASPGAVSVRLNTGSGTSFTGNGSVAVGSAPYGLALGDLDGDLTLDLVTADRSGATVSVLLNVEPPSLTGFTPPSGPEGTLVTITGTHLAGTTGIKFNGTSAAFTVVNATQVTATVPAGATTGTLSLTALGNTVTSSGLFTVTPAINSFTPTSGSAGTSVVITGTTFTGATGVKFNGVSAASYTVNSATQITATAPAGVTTGTLSVTTAGGTATSTGVFVVLPTISAFTPASAAAGAVFTLTGLNFTGATSVKFNGTEATSFTVVSDTQIQATLPVGTSSGTLSVTTAIGTGTSATSFTLLPSIFSFTPTSGAAGTRVYITGDGFAGLSGTSAVRFNVNNASNYFVASSTTLNAQVQITTTTGPITITTPAGTVTSGTNFTVTPGYPAINVFSPTSGPEGTAVNISGSNLSTATAVSFNGTPAVFNITNGTIRTTVPAGATTGYLSITNAVGTTTSAVVFTVTPALTAFAPSTGLPGTVVTLTGTTLGSATNLTLNGTALAFTIVNSNTLTATIPAGASSGTFQVTTPTGPSTTAASFAVLSVFSGTLNQCLTTGSISSTGSGAWQHLLASNGQVVAAINDGGQALGAVYAEFTVADATTVRADGGGREYFDRNWHLVAQNGFTGNSVQVKFFGLNAELSRLIAANDGDGNDIYSIGDLRLTQYSGPNENCTWSDNTISAVTARLLTPSAIEALSGATWFGVTATVADHFSEFYLNGSDQVPLPVELTRFGAERQGKGAVVTTWATASEQNSAGFVVERSSDGRAFVAISELVAGAGSSRAPRTYAWTDVHAPTGLTYYRLRQLDLDGTASYSSVVSVAPTGSTELPALLLWPNPAYGTLTLSGVTPVQPVQLLDALGRVVRDWPSASEAITGARVLDLKSLPAGSYVLRVADGRTARLVIQE